MGSQGKLFKGMWLRPLEPLRLAAYAPSAAWQGVVWQLGLQSRIDIQADSTHKKSAIQGLTCHSMPSAKPSATGEETSR